MADDEFPAEADQSSPTSAEHWFGGKEVPILLYKVNRRPLPQQNLLTEQPDDVFDHVAEVLVFGGDPIITGRRDKREWHLGNREIDLETRVISGQIGWIRATEARSDSYDPSTAEWADDVDPKNVTARSVFAFDGETRLLAVLLHSSFAESVIPDVFNEALQRGEANRDSPTTDWDVEPLLDEKDFYAWLKATNVVESVVFVAKLPNPDALEEFEPVYSRMKDLEAGQLREEITARDPDRGLRNVKNDPTSKALIALAAAAFGYVVGKGRKGVSESHYDQRQKVLRERTATLADTWEDAKHAVIELLLRRRK